MKNLLYLLCIFLITTPANAKEKLVFSTGKGATVHQISAQVLTEAYKKIGYDVQVNLYPNVRSIITANTGQIDGEISRVKGIEKKFTNLIPIPIPVNFIEGMVFAREDTNIDITDWESIRNYKIICVSGVKFVEEKLEEKKIPCYKVTSFSKSIKMLQHNRGEIAIIPRINGMNAAKKENTTDVKPIGDPIVISKLYHYLHKKNADLVPKIKDILTEMSNNGRIKEIRDLYLKQHNFNK